MDFHISTELGYLVLGVVIGWVTLYLFSVWVLSRSKKEPTRD